MSVIANIIGHTPVWVFPLIVAVLWLGSINLRDRHVPPRALFILPGVMLVMSIGNSIGTSAGPWQAVADWLGAAAIGTAIGWVLTRAPIKLDTGKIVLPRSALPLVVCIALIVWRYAFGYLYGRYPELRADASYALILIAGGALLGGVMLGRYGRIGLCYRHATVNREGAGDKAKLP